MPTPPTWLDKVNYVVDFWFDPCNAPLIVYLRLAKDPAAEAIITWLSFGLADVIRGYARPSKALGGRRTKRRGKRIPRRGRFPKFVILAGNIIKRVPGLGDDSGGWVGKNLPGAKEFKGRHISQGAINMWVLDDVGQRVLLALLIAHITIDFAYEWAVLLDMSEHCQRDSVGSLYARGAGTACGGIIICNSGSAPDVIFEEGNVGWNVATGSVGPRGWNASSAMTVKNVGVTPVTHYQQALITDALGSRNIFSETTLIQPGAIDQSILSLDIVGPGAFVVSHCCFGGVVQPEGAIAHEVFIWGGGSQ